MVSSNVQGIKTQIIFQGNTLRSSILQELLHHIKVPSVSCNEQSRLSQVIDIIDNGNLISSTSASKSALLRVPTICASIMVRICLMATTLPRRAANCSSVSLWRPVTCLTYFFLPALESNSYLSIIYLNSYVMIRNNYDIFIPCIFLSCYEYFKKSCTHHIYMYDNDNIPIWVFRTSTSNMSRLKIYKETPC